MRSAPSTAFRRRALRSGRVLCLSLLVALPASVASAQGFAAILLRTDGPEIEGESTIIGFEDMIVLDSVSNAVDVDCDLTQQNPSCGDLRFQPVEILKRVDKADPLLFQALVTTNLLNNACIRGMIQDPAGPGLVEAYRIALEAVSIESFTPVLDENELKQSLRLDYKKIQVQTIPYDPETGAPGTATSFCWDRETNAQCVSVPSCPAS